MPQPIRRVILHHHIFKNAGTTLDWALRRKFGNRYVSIEEQDTQMPRMSAGWLLAYLQDNKHVAGITSHSLHAQNFSELIGRPDEFAFMDFIVFRNPLDRFLSIYDFYRRGGGADPEAIDFARRSALDVWLEHLLVMSPHLSNDVQVHLLSGRGRYVGPPDRADLERASARLAKLAFLTATDRFDDGCIAAEHFLRPTVGTLNLAYTMQNVSPDPTGGAGPRAARLPDLIGPELHSTLLRLNELDLELLSRVHAELDRRLARVPDLERRRRDFEARKAALAASPAPDH